MEFGEIIKMNDLKFKKNSFNAFKSLKIQKLQFFRLKIYSIISNSRFWLVKLIKINFIKKDISIFLHLSLYIALKKYCI